MYVTSREGILHDLRSINISFSDCAQKSVGLQTLRVWDLYIGQSSGDPELNVVVEMLVLFRQPSASTYFCTFVAYLNQASPERGLPGYRNRSFQTVPSEIGSQPHTVIGRKERYPTDKAF
jgi:hypothetical protein